MLWEAEGVVSFLRNEVGCYVLNKLDNANWRNPRYLLIRRLRVVASHEISLEHSSVASYLKAKNKLLIYLSPGKVLP